MNERDKKILKNYFSTTERPHLCFDLDSMLMTKCFIEQILLEVLQLFMFSGIFISIATSRSFMESWQLIEAIKPNADSALCDGQLTFRYNEKQFVQNIKFDVCEYNELLLKIGNNTPGVVEEYFAEHRFSSKKVKRLFDLSFHLPEHPMFSSHFEAPNCVYLAVPPSKGDKEKFFKIVDAFHGNTLIIEKIGSCWIKIVPKRICKAYAFGDAVHSMIYFSNGSSDDEMLEKARVKVVAQNSDERFRHFRDVLELEESLTAFLLDMIKLL